MEIVIEALGGTFWVTTYILIIYKGFKDKTYGMPIPAFCLNISWEFIFSFIYLPDLDLGLTKFLWFFIDCIILYQIIKYGKNEFKRLKPLIFYLSFSILLFLSFCLILLTRREFGVTFGDFYAPYFINLFMSILFIVMFYVRNSLRGQSIYIALFKMLATAVYSIWCFAFIDELNGSKIIIFLYLSVVFFDFVYLILVYLKTKNKLLIFKQA